MALATVDDYKLLTGISGTDSDALITEAIADAEARVITYCGRQLESATVTDEYGDGLGQDFLVVSRYPVTSVTSISVRTGVSTYTELSSGSYEIRGDGSAGIIDLVSASDLWWSSGQWPGGGFGGRRGGKRRNSYKITYVGGYLSGTHDTALQDLKSIVCDLVSAMATPTDPGSREGRQVHQSENVGYQSWTFRPAADFISQFESRLDRFRKVGL